MDRFYHLGARTLREGLTGHDVKIAQAFLHQLGFKVRADGDYGMTTVKAVRTWEKATSLHPDGVLPPSEADKLRQALASGDATTAGDTPVAPAPLAPGDRAVLNSNGTASAPASAPAAVQQVIAAGNEIATKPYLWGGGHGRWTDSGYDCSGSVSFALHGGGLLDTPMASGGFTSWAKAGPGQWITTYANGGHMFMTVAGLRFDTSGAHPSRWQSAMRSPDGYTVRHPEGL